MTKSPATDRERVALLCHRLTREYEHRTGQPRMAWAQHPNRFVFGLEFLAPPPRVDADDISSESSEDESWTGAKPAP